jgi:hypothetical protein
MSTSHVVRRLGFERTRRGAHDVDVKRVIDASSACRAAVRPSPRGPSPAWRQAGITAGQARALR